MKLLVIYGTIDSGKTHTMYLVLSRLLEKGAKIVGDLYGAQRILPHQEVMATPTRIPDFRTIVEIEGKKVMLLSAGDFIGYRYWGFNAHIEYAIKINVDYVVCCARSYNQTNSVHQELRNKYSGEMLANEDWFRVIKTNNPNWLEERDQIAEKVVNKLLYYIDLEK